MYVKDLEKKMGLHSDLKCPHCNAKFDVNFDEYYEFEEETNIKTCCIECEQEFTYKWWSSHHFKVVDNDE